MEKHLTSQDIIRTLTTLGIAVSLSACDSPAPFSPTEAVKPTATKPDCNPDDFIKAQGYPTIVPVGGRESHIPESIFQIADKIKNCQVLEPDEITQIPEFNLLYPSLGEVPTFIPATAVPTSTPDKKPTQPPKTIMARLEGLPDLEQRSVDIWADGEWTKGIPLKKFNGFVINDVENPRNRQIGWLQDKETGRYYQCSQKSLVYVCSDPNQELPTSTPVPTKVPATAVPIQPSPTVKPPEVRPSATAVPEIVRPWPEKIGNMETDKIEIYNHGKEIGVTSTNWGEITYLAKKLADIGVKVKGYEFDFYDWTQTNLIPVDPNANYDQKIDWERNNFPGGGLGKQTWILGSDNILRVSISWPKILDSYSGAGKDYTIAQLNHYIDSMVLDQLCGKGDWHINSSCDPEATALYMRSLSFQKGNFSNLRAQFPTAK